ncbi:hypothetical protein K6I34_006132, partial [Streptomyces sp. UNOC14_S4]|nr:hypothetical protein [Streptomyces sp. UNOC14_S4]
MTEDKDRQGKAAERGGGIAIGRMTGGAVVSGPGARAEDRSERAARPAAREDGAAPVPQHVPADGGIAVGE